MAKELQDAALEQRLRDYLKETGMSQNKLAKTMGLKSSSAISQYLGADGYASPAALEPKLRDYFRNLDDAAARKGIDLDDPDVYVPTSVSEAVYQTIRNCHLRGMLSIECGDAGIGKTRAARKYVRDYPATAIMITADTTVNTVGALLKALCRELNLAARRRDEQMSELKQEFAGQRRTLIIDEAQHLPIKAVETLRCLSDACPKLGIMLIGNRETMRLYQGQRRVHYHSGVRGCRSKEMELAEIRRGLDQPRLHRPQIRRTL